MVKKVVLGYGPFKKEKGLLNKVIRYDTYKIALQYLSFSLSGIPIEDYFSYEKLDAVCHYFWEDGKRLKSYSNPEKFASEVELQLGVDKSVLLKSLADSKHKFDVTEEIFLHQANKKINDFIQKKLSLDNVIDKENYEQREKTLNGLVKLTYNLYNGGRDKNKILNSYSNIRELNFKLDEEKKKLKWNISKLFTSIKSTIVSSALFLSLFVRDLLPLLL